MDARDDPVFQDRYGLNTSPKRKVMARLGYAALIVALLAVVTMVGLQFAKSPVRSNDIGYEVINDSTVSVEFQVIMDPGDTATCHIEALSSRKAQVGLKSVTVGPYEKRSVITAATLKTQQRAVTGVVKSCELVSD